MSCDGIARPEWTKPIRLSRLGLDKLIDIKVDKGEALCHLIYRNCVDVSGLKTVSVIDQKASGDVTRVDLVAAVNCFEDREIINTVSIRSSALD